MASDSDYLSFNLPDELTSLTLIVEDQKLYVHKEVLATWSPVFKSMFTRDFKEKVKDEIELPDKKVDDFVELLHCMYPPIKRISDSNVFQLLPLVEEYQISEVKKKCEDFLLTKPGSMELLVAGQLYNLSQLINRCVDAVRTKSFTELRDDPSYNKLHADNLINILQLRVLDLEAATEHNRKLSCERDARLYGIVNDLASGYGNFCTECKSRKVSDGCINCLKMFRDKVKSKCEEAKTYRNQNPLFSG